MGSRTSALFTVSGLAGTTSLSFSIAVIRIMI
jgi:hypothetical protein